MELILHILDLIGTAVFAVTGALAAGRKRMDIFGVVVLGCVTALGGGTLRDVILGIRPVFWISDSCYFWVAAIAAAFTFLLARLWKPPTNIILYADAMGLAAFTVVGFRMGLLANHRYTIAILMGVMTGVVGGMIRDVLSAEMPLILRREIYASASLCGAVLLAFLTYLEAPDLIGATAAFLTTLVIRLAALYWDLSLPLFSLDHIKGNGGRP